MQGQTEYGMGGQTAYDKGNTPAYNPGNDVDDDHLPQGGPEQQPENQFTAGGPGGYGMN